VASPPLCAQEKACFTMGCCKSTWSPSEPFCRRTSSRSLSVDHSFSFGESDQDIVTAYSAEDGDHGRGTILQLNRADFGDIFDRLCDQRAAEDQRAASKVPSVCCTDVDGRQSFTFDTMTNLPNMLYISETSTTGCMKNELSLGSETTASHRISYDNIDSPRHVQHKSSGKSHGSLAVPQEGQHESPMTTWHTVPSVSSSVSRASFVAVESVTDRALTATPSCQEKETKQQGSMWERPEVVTGYVCKKGHKVDSPNQDSFLIVRSESLYSIFGVFDGHGPFGHDISNFVKEQLPRVLLVQPDLENDMAGSLRFAFDKTQRLLEQETAADRLDAHRSGTTVSLVVQNHATGDFHVAHVGDSRCVLGSIGADGEISSQDVTRDHKPEFEDEEERILKAGGEVRIDSMKVHRVYAKGKLYPGLSMSRALGDLTGVKYAGILPEPDVRQLDFPFARWSSVGNSVCSLSVQSVCSDTSVRTVGTELTPRSVNSGAGVDVPPLSPKNAGKLPPLVWPSETRKPSHPVQKPPASSTPPRGVPAAGNVRGGSGATQASFNSSSLGAPMRFLLICSDGVWEYISSKEAVEIVARFSPEDTMQAAECLSCRAWDRWQEQWQGEVVDDITVLVVHLK